MKFSVLSLAFVIASASAFGVATVRFYEKALFAVSWR
jgi:hypothetical protein